MHYCEIHKKKERNLCTEGLKFQKIETFRTKVLTYLRKTSYSPIQKERIEWEIGVMDLSEEDIQKSEREIISSALDFLLTLHDTDYVPGIKG